MVLKNVQRRAKNLKVRRVQFVELFDETSAEETTTLTWPVAAKYVVLGGKVRALDDDDWGYNWPIGDPDLFLSFARLGVRGDPTEISVLRWVSRYGLLTLKEKGSYCGPPNQAPITLEDFRAEVRRARELLNLYTELESKDADAVRTRLSRGLPFDDYWMPKRLGLFEFQRQILRNPGLDNDQVDLLAGFSVLAHFLKRLLRGVRMHLATNIPEKVIVTEDGIEIPESAYALRQSWECPDLLSAIYLQFYLMVTKSQRMRYCDNPACALPFPRTRKDKRFCNDTCRSNARHYQ